MKNSDGAPALARQPGAVGGRQVVRLFVEVDQVRPDLAQHAPEARPVEEVVAAVEADRLDAQVVGRAARVGRLELQRAAARLAPLGRGDDDQALDLGARGDLVELVAVGGDDQDLRDDQDLHGPADPRSAEDLLVDAHRLLGDLRPGEAARALESAPREVVAAAPGSRAARPAPGRSPRRRTGRPARRRRRPLRAAPRRSRSPPACRTPWLRGPACRSLRTATGTRTPWPRCTAAPCPARGIWPVKTTLPSRPRRRTVSRGSGIERVPEVLVAPGDHQLVLAAQVLGQASVGLDDARHVLAHVEPAEVQDEALGRCRTARARWPAATRRGPGRQAGVDRVADDVDALGRQAEELHDVALRSTPRR